MFTFLIKDLSSGLGSLLSASEAMDGVPRPSRALPGALRRRRDAGGGRPGDPLGGRPRLRVYISISLSLSLYIYIYTLDIYHMILYCIMVIFYGIISYYVIQVQARLLLLDGEPAGRRVGALH